MRFPFSTTPALRLAAGTLSLVLLSACQTMVWTPASTMPVSLSRTGSVPDTSKQYVLTSDWQDGAWVMKRGAKITFRADGMGSFSGRLFTVLPARKQEFHFQSVQYGRDGNLLFPAPAADLGYSIHARHAEADYPVDFNFGYDARQFPFIARVLFTARIRKPEDAGSVTTTTRTTTHSVYRESGK